DALPISLRGAQPPAGAADRDGAAARVGRGRPTGRGEATGGTRRSGAGGARMKVRTLIVDDEGLSRRGVELRLRNAADFEIVAQCATGREALAAIQQYKPDLVFLDIQMPGMSGFEVLAHLPQESLQVVMFVTAYDQIAILAFEARAVADLLRSIEWIDAAGDYMCIHAAVNTHILRGTIKELEEILDPRLFQRVHRSTIVNLRLVKSLRAHMNGEYFLTLEGGHELKLSRIYREKVEYFLSS